jgi:hypothetical protein
VVRVVEEIEADVARERESWTPASPEEAVVRDMVEWLADAADLPTTEVFGRVVSQLNSVVATRPSRTSRRRRVASELVAYYGEDRLLEVNLRPYRIRVGGRTLDVAIALRESWCRCGVALVNPIAPNKRPDERCVLVAASPLAMPFGSPGILDRAVDRLAIATVGARAGTGPVMFNKPLYRLMAIELDKSRLKAEFALDEFAHYALSYDLLAAELDSPAVGNEGGRRWPLRDRLLPDAAIVADISNRLCTGGFGCLFAIARPASWAHPADFLLVIQQRSDRVLNVPGSLSVMPRAFHQHLVDAQEEVALGMTVARELEEEMFGRIDVDESRGRSELALNPQSASRRPAPMRWLAERGAYTAECAGFGINLSTGEFWFACLACVPDEEFWEEHGGSCLPNWEASDVQTYSTAEPGRLQELITDERWTSEGLFAFLEGLRRLADRFPERVSLPDLEVQPA